MATLDLSIDEILTTTRAVRKRLDLQRPVEAEILMECLEIAVQAPSGGGNQGWHFIVVTDAQQRLALAKIYRKAASAAARYQERMRSTVGGTLRAEQETKEQGISSYQYLVEHLHEVPVLLIPCIRGRLEDVPVVMQATLWGSIIPATWSFMLAARARGLGTCWTTLHLSYEQETADLLGIPYKQVTQVALIPVAYTLGTTFHPAQRKPLEAIVHWEKW